MQRLLHGLLKFDTVNGATVRGVARLLGIFLLKTGHCLQSYCGVNVRVEE
jgi:hypothetical protein